MVEIRQYTAARAVLDVLSVAVFLGFDVYFEWYVSFFDRSTERDRFNMQVGPNHKDWSLLQRSTTLVSLLWPKYYTVTGTYWMCNRGRHLDCC